MEAISNRFKDIANQLGGLAGIVEKFVENNIIEKEQREQNIKKLAKSVDEFINEKIKSRFHEPINVKVQKLDNFRGELPAYETLGASGMDVRAQLLEDLVLEHGERVLVPTGLSMEIPKGYEIQVRPRSGWALREGLTVLNTPGTIDSDYRGELKVILINLGNRPIKVVDQERIAQLVLCPVNQIRWREVKAVSDSDRGSGGFGSTGRNE